MPQPWLKDIKRRSVETDYNFYDPPSVIWNKLHGESWPYKTHQSFYILRDQALMCLLYLTCARISEITRGIVRAGRSLSVKKSQFVLIGDFVMVRNIPIYKRKYIQRGGKWSSIENINEYPNRIELPLPLKGDLSIFSNKILEYIEQLDEDEELFKFLRYRGFKIIRHVTREFPHYFRSMGLKMWLRLFNNDLVRLKQFSGHRRLSDLGRYLSTSWLESKEEILGFKMTNHKDKLR